MTDARRPVTSLGRLAGAGARGCAALALLVAGCAAPESRTVESDVDAHRVSHVRFADSGEDVVAGASPEPIAGGARGASRDEIRAAGSRGDHVWRAKLHVELARVYFENGALDVAEDEATLAAEIDSDSSDAAHWLALIAVAKGEDARARRFFERALSARGAADNGVLARNYARFVCDRLGRCTDEGATNPVFANRHQAAGKVADNRVNIGVDSRIDDGKGEDAAGRSFAKSAATHDGSRARPGDGADTGPHDGGSEVRDLPVPKLGQLRAQSIAIDNSAASDPFRELLNDGRTGQSPQATGGMMERRNRQEYSSEE